MPFEIVKLDDQHGQVVPATPTDTKTPYILRPRPKPKFQRQCQDVNAIFVKRVRLYMTMLPGQKLLDPPDSKKSRPWQKLSHAAYLIGHSITRFLPPRIAPYFDLVFVNIWFTGIALGLVQAFNHTLNILVGFAILHFAQRSDPAYGAHVGAVALNGALGGLVLHALLVVCALPLILYAFHIAHTFTPADAAVPAPSWLEETITFPFRLGWHCVRSAGSGAVGAWILAGVRMHPETMDVAHAARASVVGALVLFVPRFVGVKLAWWQRRRLHAQRVEAIRMAGVPPHYAPGPGITRLDSGVEEKYAGSSWPPENPWSLAY